LCNDLFTFLIPGGSGTLKSGGIIFRYKKRPPESGFSEAFF
jgi:hypothetical protein